MLVLESSQSAINWRPGLDHSIPRRRVLKVKPLFIDGSYTWINRARHPQMERHDLIDHAPTRTTSAFHPWRLRWHSAPLQRHPSYDAWWFNQRIAAAVEQSCRSRLRRRGSSQPHDRHESSRGQLFVQKNINKKRKPMDVRKEKKSDPKLLNPISLSLVHCPIFASLRFAASLFSE
jgi:hypothetical protein